MRDLEQAVTELHEALMAVEDHPDPTVRSTLARLVRSLKDLHEEGVRRLASLALGNPDAAKVALSDPVVANLLQLYGVTDGDGRPSVVEVLADGGREGSANLKVRLDSGDTVSFIPQENVRRIEKRVREAAGPPPTGADSGAPRGNRVAATLDEIEAEGGILGRLVHGYPVLLVSVDGEVQAYRNTCPGSLLPLHLGGMQEGEIHCPWHGCDFDAATGRRLDREGEPLQALTVAVGDGQVEVELP